MRVLILSKPNSQFCLNISQVFDLFDCTLFRSEHSFPKVQELVDFVGNHKITHVLMPNPYGNNKRLACYKKLKECNIAVIASDRGALPNSWFFDSGFNFDSESYQPKKWKGRLSQEQIQQTEMYINNFRQGNEALESQGKRFGGEVLKKKLELEGKNIVFVPLQRPSDTVIKYFSGFAKSVGNFVEQLHELEREINKVDNNKWIFLLKKHPLEVSYFPIVSDNIYYVADDTNVYDLIEMADAVALINSGVGLNALLYNKKVLCFGDAFYAHKRLAIACKTLGDAIAALQEDYSPEYKSIIKFTHYLLHSVYSFGDFETEVIRVADGFRNETRAINFHQIRILGEAVQKKQRVLLVAPLVPFPIYRGNQARIDAVIRWLLDNNYSVELVVVNGSFAGKASITLAQELMDVYPKLADIKVFKDPKYNKKWHKYKFSLEKIIDGLKGGNHKISNIQSCPTKLMRYIKNRVQEKEFDYLFLNYARLGNAIPTNFSGRVVIDTHDYQSQFLQEDQEINGKSKQINLIKFRESEHQALNKADTLLAINPLEEVMFRDIVSDEKSIVTVPAFYEDNTDKKINFITYNYDVLYVGSVSNFNVSGLKWFLENSLPYLLESKPDIKIAIAGNINRSKDIDWSNYPNLTVLGIVPDLSQLYFSSACCIAPILGGAGMKIKIVEALSYNKAIVATYKAAEGINVESYETPMVLTDEPKVFAQSVAKIVNQKSYRVYLEKNAKQLFSCEHSVEAVSTALNKVFMNTSDKVIEEG